ncbi:FAD-dependent oxidoreductase [Exiguobacterium sp. SL14]|nr:FAD-dependent oxidoreductase [Exiguobacterium sp. SL14]MCY1690871.1 FAD-dependent oxidoreductase [Exiguobacterium sp. SL14]
MYTHIIIGAGILGASTAYHLSKAGERVLLVDRKEPGRASHAAAGIICPWMTQRRNKAWYQLANNGAHFYKTLIPELEALGETSTGYQQVGTIALHETSKIEKMETIAHNRFGSPCHRAHRTTRSRACQSTLPACRTDRRCLIRLRWRSC